MHFRDSSPHPICNSGDDAWQWPVFFIMLFFCTVYHPLWCTNITLIRCLSHRVCRAKQTASRDKEHSQTGPGDWGATPRQGSPGGGQGHSARQTGERPDPERSGHCEYKDFSYIDVHNVYHGEDVWFFSGCVYHCLPWLWMWLYLTFACINWCAEGQKHGIKLTTTYRSVTINMLPTHQYMCMNLIIFASLDIYLLC